MPGLDQNEGAYVLKEWRGLRNIVPPEAFEEGDLTSAKNIDIDNAKRMRRRSGFPAPTISGFYEWLWTDRERVFAVRNGTALVELNSTLSAFTTIRSDLTPGLRMVYTSPVSGFVYYTNGAQRGAIVHGRPRSWGLERPPYAGTASLVGGSLPVGTYRHLVAFVRGTGEESGAPRSDVITTTEGQGIKLSNIPVSSDPDVIAKKVYFSAPTGGDVYWVGTIPNYQTEFWYVAQLPLESVCPTEHLYPPPVAYELTTYGGWVLAATDSAVRISEPYQWDLWDLRKGFNTGSRPLLLAAVNDGIYLGTEGYIAWLPGSAPETMQFKQVADYGVIPGTVAMMAAEEVTGRMGKGVVFASKEGICVGLDGGVIKNVTGDRFAYPLQDRGAGLIRNIRGVPQFVVTLQGTETPSPKTYTEQT